MNDEILFLAHRLPFPPDRGDKIRSHHILKALAKIAPVHVGCFVENDSDRREMGELATIAKSYCVGWRRKKLLHAGIESLFRHEPVSLSAFRCNELQAWVNNLLDSGKIGAIYVFSGQMGQFVPADWKGHFTMDLVDVDSAKFEAYAKEAGFPQNWINRREGKLLAQFEKQLAARAEHTLLVSDAEAELMRERASDGRDVRALCNGIDAATFRPGCVQPTLALAGGGPDMIFTGQMDYPPNVEAVKRMAKSILPKIRKTHPKAQFHIVGRAPTESVVALDEIAGCNVHGEVPDMRPYLAASDLVVAPLTLARGVQNKVLEGMAMELPVLLSPEAATGISATNGEHFLIAKDDDEFAELACQIIEDRQEAERLGKAAREFVLENQSWGAMLAELPQLLGLAVSGAGQGNGS